MAEESVCARCCLRPAFVAVAGAWGLGLEATVLCLEGTVLCLEGGRDDGFGFDANDGEVTVVCRCGLGLALAFGLAGLESGIAAAEAAGLGLGLEGLECGI